jgi:hypothetical protein
MAFRSALLPFACLVAAPALAQDATQSPTHAPAAPSAAPFARSVQSGGGILAATSSPGNVVTLYTNIATSPTSNVPGLPGTQFTSGSGSTNFERPWVSPNGLHWGIRADTPLATSMDSVLIVDNALALQEGTPCPFSTGPGNFGQTDIRIGINDNGDYAYFTNTTESANDDYIVKVTAGPTYTVIAQEAAAIPALPGATYDDDLDSITLLADGRVSFRADGIDGAGVVTTTDDELFIIDNAINAREGITIPAGQDSGGMATWESFTFENSWVSPDGLHVLLDGDLLGTTNDDVTVYDGNVVIQESFPIPGTAFTSAVVSGGADEVGMDAAGRWMARGNNADGQDWVVRNGIVLAKTDDPIGTTGESWDDTDFTDGFFAFASNMAGDYVVGGLTNAPSTMNGVLVLNDAFIILREGDPVDVDGNGLFDEDAFYNTFGNDDLALLEDGTLYFTATLRNGAGTAFAQGVFRREGGNLQEVLCFGDGSGTACPCGNDSPVGANAGCLNSMGVGGRLDAAGTASIANDSLSLLGTDMPNSSALYFQGTTLMSGGAGAVFGDGLRCASGTTIRLKTVANTGNSSMYPQPGDPSISVRGLVTMPGVRAYQIWYRNAAAFCTVSTFNLTNAVQITWGS